MQPKEAGITRAQGDRRRDRRALHLALVNEGARILEEGIALRAADIDMVYLTGYGFPAYRGGPMLYAESIGLPNVVEKMRQFAAQPGGDAAFWAPAASLVRHANAGESFN